MTEQGVLTELTHKHTSKMETRVEVNVERRRRGRRENRIRITFINTRYLTKICPSSKRTRTSISLEKPEEVGRSLTEERNGSRNVAARRNV